MLFLETVSFDYCRYGSSSLRYTSKMATNPEIAASAEAKDTIPIQLAIDEKKGPLTTDLELAPSEKEGEVEIITEGDYSPKEYKKLLRKIDRFLLPLMWFCYGVQQTDKTSLGTQAIFGLRTDTGLVGQQYSWLTTIFYIAYMCGEFPSNFLLQRWSLGKSLSIYMFCWGKAFQQLDLTRTKTSCRRLCDLHWRCSELGPLDDTTCLTRLLRVHHLSRIRARHWQLVYKRRTLLAIALLPVCQRRLWHYRQPVHVRHRRPCPEARRPGCMEMYLALPGILHGGALDHLFLPAWKPEGGHLVER